MPLSGRLFRLLTSVVSPIVVVEAMLKTRRRVFGFLGRVHLPVVTRPQLRDGCGPWVTELFDKPDRTERADPIIVGREPDELASVPRSVEFKPPFVSVITGATLMGGSALALDSRRRIVLESVGPDSDAGTPGFYALPLSSLVRRLQRRADEAIEKPVCSLMTTFSRIYGHWLVEALPRLEGYEHFCRLSGERPLLLIEDDAPAWKLQSLELMGYGRDDLLPWSGRTTNVKTLVLPSIRRQSGWLEPRACEWLRERLVSALPESSAPAYARRVLISRGAAAGRRILNEDELMAALSPFGFDRHQPETMHFAEEVRLFAGAEIVVAVHGSGLTNAVLSAKKPLVIDLFDDFWTPEFVRLAATSGARYACVRSESRKPAAGMRRAENDSVVDVDAIVRLISQQLL